MYEIHFKGGQVVLESGRFDNESVDTKIIEKNINKSKPGQRPQAKVNVEWSPDFAYAIGLLVSDGSLSKDGRHISFVSKDIDQVENFCRALKVNYIPAIQRSSIRRLAYRVQVGDVNFYKFLNSIGLTKAKSLTVGSVLIPTNLFSHYLRGYFDGDGCTYSYFDKRWKSSFMLYLGFVSGSYIHIVWLKDMIYEYTKVSGYITKHTRVNTWYQLRYSKQAALKLIDYMYKDKGDMFLKRKYLKIKDSLAIVGATSLEE